MKRTAYVEIRSQHSVGSSANRFGGPDTYVAVQIVPEGTARLRILQERVAQKRGIEILYCGEGYKRHDGPRSMLGQALARAERIVTRINGATHEE